MTCTIRGDTLRISSRPTSPTSRATTPVKYVKVPPEINSISVKQSGGKDFTICMNPANLDFSFGQGGKAGSCNVKNGESGRPVSIVIQAGPKNKVPVHAVFNNAADRREAAIIQAAKDKLSYNISSPSEGLQISLNGGTLQDRMGSPGKCQNKVHACSCSRPTSPSQGGGTEGCTFNSSNNSVKLCMLGSGMKLNIKVGNGKTGSRVSCSSPDGQNTVGFQVDCGPAKRKLDFHHCRPTISSLISVRMTQLLKEMKMNSDLNPPAPPFIKF